MQPSMFDVVSVLVILLASAVGGTARSTAVEEGPKCTPRRKEGRCGVSEALRALFWWHHGCFVGASPL